MLGQWEFKIRGPPWDQKIIKNKKKQCWPSQQKIEKIINLLHKCR